MSSLESNVGDFSEANAPAYQAALDAMRAQLLAMPDAQVHRGLTFDASAASVMAEASAKKVAPYRAELVAMFGPDAGTLVDELPVIARAARQSVVEVESAATLVDLAAMHAEVRAAHKLLITDADSLANRGLIDVKRLEATRNLLGHEAVIRSVLRLVFVLREHWTEVEPHTPLTTADLDRAEGLAQAMANARGDRENGVNRAPALELRRRATSKLTSLYEEVRRMMTFLRWHQGDVDVLIPSLWTSRARKGRTSRNVVERDLQVDTDIDAPLPASPAVPSPMNGDMPFTA